MPVYVGWALLGMLGYSATTLLVKKAVGAGAPPPYVLSVATLIVTSGAALNAWLRGAYAGRGLTALLDAPGLWCIAVGIALFVAVFSLFRGLATGPASVVVPIYGMFIAGAALGGMLFLHEPASLRKLIGIAVAAAGVVLIAG